MTFPSEALSGGMSTRTVGTSPNHRAAFRVRAVRQDGQDAVRRGAVGQDAFEPRTVAVELDRPVRLRVDEAEDAREVVALGRAEVADDDGDRLVLGVRRCHVDAAYCTKTLFLRQRRGDSARRARARQSRSEQP